MDRASSKHTLQNQGPMTQDNENKYADDVFVVGPDRRPNTSVNDRVRDVMQVQTYVRIERFMLARPTAASPANYKKRYGCKAQYFCRDINEVVPG